MPSTVTIRNPVLRYQGTRTVKARRAGCGSTLPFRSIARTSKRWAPPASFRNDAELPSAKSLHLSSSSRQENSSISGSVIFHLSTPENNRCTGASGAASRGFTSSLSVVLGGAGSASGWKREMPRVVPVQMRPWRSSNTV